MTVDTKTTPGSGSWVCPTGVSSVQIECWGGGGSGAPEDNGYSNHGGGGGAYAIYALAVTAGQSYSYFVGGENQDSWFKNTAATVVCKAVCGTSNLVGHTGSPGAGGAASSCIPTTGAVSGQNGTRGGDDYPLNYGGDGGTGANGGIGGLGAVYNDDDASDYPAEDGTQPGGGGGGGAGGQSVNASPGNGAPGQIVLTYTASGSTTQSASLNSGAIGCATQSGSLNSGAVGVVTATTQSGSVNSGAIGQATASASVNSGAVGRATPSGALNAGAAGVASPSSSLNSGAVGLGVQSGSVNAGGLGVTIGTQSGSVNSGAVGNAIQPGSVGGGGYGSVLGSGQVNAGSVGFATQSGSLSTGAVGVGTQSDSLSCGGMGGVPNTLPLGKNIWDIGTPVDLNVEVMPTRSNLMLLGGDGVVVGNARQWIDENIGNVDPLNVMAGNTIYAVSGREHTRIEMRIKSDRYSGDTGCYLYFDEKQYKTFSFGKYNISPDIVGEPCSQLITWGSNGPWTATGSGMGISPEGSYVDVAWELVPSLGKMYSEAKLASSSTWTRMSTDNYDPERFPSPVIGFWDFGLWGPGTVDNPGPSFTIASLKAVLGTGFYTVSSEPTRSAGTFSALMDTLTGDDIKSMAVGDTTGWWWGTGELRTPWLHQTSIMDARFYAKLDEWLAPEPWGDTIPEYIEYRWEQRDSVGAITEVTDWIEQTIEEVVYLDPPDTSNDLRLAFRFHGDGGGVYWYTFDGAATGFGAIGGGGGGATAPVQHWAAVNMGGRGALIQADSVVLGALGKAIKTYSVGAGGSGAKRQAATINSGALGAIIQSAAIDGGAFGRSTNTAQIGVGAVGKATPVSGVLVGGYGAIPQLASMFGGAFGQAIAQGSLNVGSVGIATTTAQVPGGSIGQATANATVGGSALGRQTSGTSINGAAVGVAIVGVGINGSALGRAVNTASLNAGGFGCVVGSLNAGGEGSGTSLGYGLVEGGAVGRYTSNVSIHGAAMGAATQQAQINVGAIGQKNINGTLESGALGLANIIDSIPVGGYGYATGAKFGSVACGGQGTVVNSGSISCGAKGITQVYYLPLLPVTINIESYGYSTNVIPYGYSVKIL